MKKYHSKIVILLLIVSLILAYTTYLATSTVIGDTNGTPYICWGNDGTISIDNTFSISTINNVQIIQNSNGEVCIMQNEDIIGGIERYQTQTNTFPRIMDVEADHLNWLANLGVPEAKVNPTDYMISTGLYNGWEVWFGCNGMSITRNLFAAGDYIYDIWFNDTITGGEISSYIMNSVTFRQQ